MIDTVFSAIRREVEARKSSRTDYVMNGGATTQEQYHHAIGAFQELLALEDMLKDLEKRMLDE